MYDSLLLEYKNLILNPHHNFGVLVECNRLE